MSPQFTLRGIIRAVLLTLVCPPIAVGLIAAPAAAQAIQDTTSTYVYDALGNLTQTTDPLGRLHNVSFDALGRPATVTDPTPVSGQARPVTTLGYDGLDQVVGVTDPRNLITSYTIDGLGAQTGLNSPDTNLSGMTFDVAGNMLSKTDARGKLTTFTYDALGRMVRNDYASGTASVIEYDGGTAGAPNDIGHLTKITDESGATTFSYDGHGRLLALAQSSATATGASVNLHSVRTYGTDVGTLGKLTSLTYPSGNRVNYAYDAAGRLSGMTLNPSDHAGGTDLMTTIVLVSDVVYSPFGAPQSWSWGNNNAAQPSGVTRTFDLDGRMTSYPLGNAASDGLVRTVVYDAGSRITAMTHTGGATAANYNQSFTYDGLDRLTGVTGAPGSLGYAYDSNGNRTTARIGTTSYTDAISTTSNRLAATNGPVPLKSNQFDTAGNLLGDGTASYTYSDRGRLARATKDGMSTDYLYNALGQRMSKAGPAVDGGANFYAYDEAGHLLGEYAASGGALQETVYFGNTPVAVLAMSAVYYVYADQIDTPRVITNSATNQIVWRWDAAEPFGSTAANGNPYGTAVFTYNPRFPGQLFDKESNLHYNYFRDYDPQTGRYVQSDPIGLGGGVNTYAYVGGNPVSSTDPLGLAVYITGHVAANPIGKYLPVNTKQAYHLALVMKPDCGSGSGTLGGQPTKGGLGNLVTATNFPGDSLDHSTFIQRVPTPHGQTDSDFIMNLSMAAQRYQNNLDYSFPNIFSGDIGKGYNSDSYVSGVIIAAGGTPPDLFINGTDGGFTAPGYSHPMPIPPGRNFAHGGGGCKCEK